MKKQLITFIFCCIFCVFVGWVCYSIGQDTPRVIELEIPMSVQQTQLALRAAGYDIVADNIWGPATERAYCDYCAVRSMHRMKGE